MAQKKIKNWAPLCNACKARCCKYICLEIDTPTCKKDYDNIRWHLMHDDVVVFIDHEDKWNLQVERVCKNLGPKNKCLIYETRPRICSDYPGENLCEYEGDEPPHKILFNDDEEFTTYLDNKKIDWKFKKRK